MYRFHTLNAQLFAMLYLYTYLDKNIFWYLEKYVDNKSDKSGIFNFQFLWIILAYRIYGLYYDITKIIWSNFQPTVPRNLTSI